MPRRKRPALPTSPTPLLTAAEHAQLLTNGRSRRDDHVPVAKLFLANATWLLSECDPDAPLLTMALSDLGFGFPELGWIDLQELEITFMVPVRMTIVYDDQQPTTRTVRMPMRIERDAHFEGRWPISVYAQAARHERRIVERGEALERASRVFEQRDPRRAKRLREARAAKTANTPATETLPQPLSALALLA